MSILKNKILIILAVLFLVSCESMFQLRPKDQLLEEDYWQTEADVESSVMTCYYNLRRCQDEMLLSGTCRSDIVVHNNTDLKNAQRGVFTSADKLCDWSKWYNLIQSANIVIDKAEDVIDLDPSYTESVHNTKIAEAKFFRAFAYFHLIRQWKNVPIVKNASLNDAQDYYPAKSDNPDQVLDFIEEDLDFAMKYMPIEHKDIEDPERDELLTRARATRSAVWALASDVYLWRNKYSECVSVCDSILSNPFYTLEPNERWFDIFNPLTGNSSEAIFELNYDDEYDYSISRSGSRWGYSILDWYKDRIKVNTRITTNWPYPDVRYYTVMGTSFNQVRKHVGSSATGNGIINSSIEPNWIIYRLPQIMYNKAEALNRLGNGNINEVNNLISQMEARAGSTEFEPLTGGVNIVEVGIINYKLKELAFEGTRWYDLVRVGRRQWDDNLTGEDNVLIKALVEFTDDAYKTMVKGNLNNPESWYVPISEDELLLNPNLEQNPFYNNI